MQSVIPLGKSVFVLTQSKQVTLLYTMAISGHLIRGAVRLWVLVEGHSESNM